MSKCNMRTVRSLVVAAVAAGGLSLGLSASGAKPGAPTTTIYYETNGLSVLNKVNSDGTGAAVLANYGPFSASSSHPSYQLHGGKRWFVRIGWTDGTYTQLDMFFHNDAGATLAYPIDPDLANDNLGAARWVPANDAEVSIIGQRASNGEKGMFAIPVTFDSFGNPTPGTPHLKLVTPFFWDASGPCWVSAIAPYDWNPTGTVLTFRPATYSGNPYPSGVYTLDSTGTLRQAIAGPWSVPIWGPTNKICSGNSGGLYTFNPDGSGLTLISSKAVGGFWSPDGSQIAFGNNNDRTRKYEVDKITITGATITKVVSATSAAWPIGWR